MSHEWSEAFSIGYGETTCKCLICGIWYIDWSAPRNEVAQFNCQQYLNRKKRKNESQNNQGDAAS